MNVSLTNIGKRFGRDWIFRHVDLQVGPGSTLISGGNGSGKSTLLSIISGYGTPTEGDIDFSLGGDEVLRENSYANVAISAPYLELYEEFTLEESINFHQKLKPLADGITSKSLVDLMGLQPHRNKQVKYFSSGMKQRVKLALALCSKASLVLLDEPGSNLDANGLNWYLQLVKDYGKDKSIVVFSVGESAENAFCTGRYTMEAFKSSAKV
jgi:ABC-type multidrug transport system ATPase subunit